MSSECKCKGEEMPHCQNSYASAYMNYTNKINNEKDD